MFHRVFVVGLLAGLVAGLAIAVLQQFTTSPLILAAEVYEKAADAKRDQHATAADPVRLAPVRLALAEVPLAERPTVAVATDRAEAVPMLLVHAHGEAGAPASAHDASPADAHDGHSDEGWAPQDGLERIFATTLATVLTAIGYALILVAGMLVAGDRITPPTALAWAAAAFAASGLATGLGLAPELPGSAAADLVARQLWWVRTAIATAAALWCLIRIDGWAAKALGVALLLAPHVIGAPKPAGFESTAPAELAAHFASTSLALHAALWLSVGAAVGFFWRRTEPRTAANSTATAAAA